MKLRNAIAIALVLAIALLAHFGPGWYQQKRFSDKAAPIVKNATLRIVNATRHETEEAANPTYAEAFDRLQNDIADLENQILELQMLATPNVSDVSTPTLAYLRAVQDALRGALSKYRKSLEFNASVEQVKNEASQGKRRGIYNPELEIMRLERLLESLKNSRREYSDARSQFVTTLRGLKQARDFAKDVFSADILITDQWLSVMSSKNEEEIPGERQS
jgi:hypothetical protein